MSAYIDTQLQKQIAATIEGLGYAYVGAESVRGSTPLLRVYVEGLNNTTIGLDEITVITRQLGALLDVESPWSGRYRLEVSSPGLDRRLFTLADYQRYIGREIKVRLCRPQAERSNWVGKLLEISGDNGQHHIVLEVEGQLHMLALDNIKKANLVPQFNLHSGTKDKKLGKKS
jgi:ribosome maturation factor RimP